MQRAARDPETFSSAAGVDLDETSALIGEGNFLAMDPPRHDSLRKALRHRFTPAAIRTLESDVRAEAVSLIDDVYPRGEGDLAVDIAWRLPVIMVSRLLAFPRSDLAELEALLKDVIWRDPDTREIPEQAWDAADRLHRYIDSHASSRRNSPGEDLLSDIVRAQESGEIAANEVSGLCFLLYLAGTETVADLISNSLLVLSRHPEQRAAIVEDRLLIPSAIEELLRFESPIQNLARTTARDATVAGITIPKGSRVLLLWGSANRDERQFKEPDHLDLRRERKRHVAFGEGIHFCLGAHLARLQAKVVFEELFERMPNYEVVGEVARAHTHNTRGVLRLPLAWKGP